MRMLIHQHTLLFEEGADKDTPRIGIIDPNCKVGLFQQLMLADLLSFQNLVTKVKNQLKSSFVILMKAFMGIFI